MDCTVCEQEALLQRPTLAFRTAYFVVMEAGKASQPKMDICKNPFQTFCGSLDHWTCEQPGFLWAKRRQAPPCFPSRLRLSHQGTQTKFCVLVCVRGRGEKYTFSPAELSSERGEKEVLADSTQLGGGAAAINAVARELLRSACLPGREKMAPEGIYSATGRALLQSMLVSADDSPPLFFFSLPPS